MLKQSQFELIFKTKGQSFLNITQTIQQNVDETRIRSGMCYLFIQHTSASLLIQENASPDVLTDFERFFSKLVPENASYIHDDEGPDDMPAHIRTALTRTSEAIPVRNGKLALGTWQGIYVWEHRSRPHERRVIVHLVGE